MWLWCINKIIIIIVYFTLDNHRDWNSVHECKHASVSQSKQTYMLLLYINLRIQCFCSIFHYMKLDTYNCSETPNCWVGAGGWTILVGTGIGLFLANIRASCLKDRTTFTSWSTQKLHVTLCLPVSRLTCTSQLSLPDDNLMCNSVIFLHNFFQMSLVQCKHGNI